jgi:ethanolamine ammonia-lyase small subunit
MSKQIVENPWLQLRRFTHARIALGRVGDSLPTRQLLELGLAHALARDAVHEKLKTGDIIRQLRDAGFDPVYAHSAAPDRTHYLRRPDLGRKLDEASYRRLRNLEASQRPDLVFVIADGLSAVAAERHALPVLHLVRAQLPGWLIAPVVVAEQSRVALGDEIGEILNAELLVIMLGERPGLSSPDSLGIYVTYLPRVGRTDAERNCISNVRPEGLSYEAAAYKLHFLLTGARKLRMTGVQLKDGSDLDPLSTASEFEKHRIARPAVPAEKMGS